MDGESCTMKFSKAGAHNRQCPEVLQTKLNVSKIGEPPGQRFGPTGKSNLTLGYSCVKTNEEVVAQSRRQRRYHMTFSKIHVKTSPGNSVTWNETKNRKGRSQRSIQLHHMTKESQTQYTGLETFCNAKKTRMRTDLGDGGKAEKQVATNKNDSGPCGA
jgi:hypothetical protein